MSTLRPFWQFLESRPRPTAVLAEWQRCTGAAFKAIQPFLCATGDSATSYPNPSSDGRPLRVVHHRDATVVAVDPEGEGTRVPLAETDLAVFGVDFKGLRGAVASALGLTTSRAALDGKPVVVPMGYWEPKPSAAFPVVLVRPTSSQQARDIIQPLAATAEKPTLIFTPTRECWPDDVPNYCQRRKCLIVPLDEILDLDGTSLVATDAWGRHLGAFCQYAALTLPASFHNKRPKRRRADRAAKIEAVKKELMAHILAARDHAFSLEQSNREPRLLKRPSKTELARRASIKAYDLTRCFQDDPQIKQLWNIAGDLDLVMKYGR